ncbi:hypothetical protein GGX14DRAFT_696567 [Mycena pura]|uniref:DUF6533 domain-containing protein n=1 Tax=Mycena pura TaxID=153505 RepID=A0AAD6VNG1_9AGAR|nr:hypothetical protein GGX14DRAFT_696567 [Mycena pura]
MELAPFASPEIQVVYYFKAAFLTLLVYDILLQLNEEYLHVWRSRWTLIKFLYLWTRYSAFIGTAGPLAHASHGQFTCDAFAVFIFIFSAIGISMADMILTVRTYTLYERSKKLLAFLFVFWSCLSGIALWAATKSQGRTHFALSHQKITTFWRSMYRDGLWFYLAILPFTIATVICLYAAPNGLSNMFDTPVQVMHSILCCRLVTHARDVAAEEDRRKDAINKV